MSGPCADCGGPDYQTLEALIAELKAELAAMKGRYSFSFTADVQGVETPFDVDLVPKPELDKAEATIERMKVGGNCAHWYAGLLGCEMDAEQEIVCEGRDHCKVFNQAIGGPREPCWAARAEEGSGE